VEQTSAFTSTQAWARLRDYLKIPSPVKGEGLDGREKQSLLLSHIAQCSALNNFEIVSKRRTRVVC